jgi:hypothetical protein
VFDLEPGAVIDRVAFGIDVLGDVSVIRTGRDAVQDVRLGGRERGPAKFAEG